MIPSVTRHPISIPFSHAVSSPQITLDRDFELLSFPEKLRSIGLIDEHFNVQFTPKEIPEIGKKGKARFDHLMKREVQCCNAEGAIIVSMKHSEYISGFKSVLSEKGIEIQSYLRGGYASYVADLGEYFEFLIHEFLTSKDLPIDLLDKEIETFKILKEIAPHDVDLFDQVLTNGIPSTALCNYHIEFLAPKKKIKFLQLLLPGKATPLYPYPADYVLFTLGNESFQTDRIIGRLHHEYLHARDDIRIEIKDNQMGIPESAGNFWQMVIDRKLKIVRTEKWHEKDFRAGLAALQLIQDGHILVEDHCSLQRILQYALSIGDAKIFTGAINRAKLHCKDRVGFLLSVLIAYSHTAIIQPEHLKILMDEIGEIPALPSLYKYALLLTLYKDKIGSAEWDPSGFLILYWNKHRIVFPKNFSITSTEKPFFSSIIGSWIKESSSVMNPVYKLLDGELSHLERVLFEISLQKAFTPLSEELKEALVEYLIYNDTVQERVAIAKLLPFEFSACSENMEWMKTFLKYSFKHGLKLWNAFKITMKKKERLEAFEEIIQSIGFERPNFSYVLLDEEPTPKNLRIKLLRLLVESPALSIDLAVKIIDELLENHALGMDKESFLVRTIEKLPIHQGYSVWKKLESAFSLSPKLLQAIDRLIASEKKELLYEDEAWFFNSLPSQERIEALYSNLKKDKPVLGILLKWMTWKISLNQPEDYKEAIAVFKNHKDDIRTLPDIYVSFIKQIHQVADKDTAVLMQSLGEKWIDSFPLPERMDQVLLFFSQYEPRDYPLLEIISSLNGLSKQKIIEALYLKGQPIFANRSVSDLLIFLNYDFSLPIKKEILKILAKRSFDDKELSSLQRFAKANPPLSLHLISYLLPTSNISVLSTVLNHLIFLHSTKSSSDVLFTSLWLKALDLSFANPATLPVLIPFFQDRRWIKSVYGEAGENKTQEWGDLVLIRGKLKKTEQSAVEDILSRTKLIHTPLVELRSFLEALHDQKLVREDMIKPYFIGIFSALSKLIKKENNEDTYHSIYVFHKLLKLGITSKLLTISELNQHKGFHLQPIVHYEDFVFNPLLHLIQNFPLVDFSSSELYDEWNTQRMNTIKTCEEEPQGFKILPYTDMKAALGFAHLFKLITEQYIEKKVSKDEFQEEVQELSKSVAQKFKNQKLIASEEPCLICISDLSFLLKNKTKRERAYEAFYYMMSRRTNKMESESPFFAEARSYLEIRQKTENLIISNVNLLEKNKIIHCQFYTSFKNHLDSLATSSRLQNLHIQDPVFDALELENIVLIDRIDLQKIWFDIIIKSDVLYNPFEEKKIKGYIAFKTKQLIEDGAEKYFLKRVLSLKAAKKSLTEAVFISEIEMIINSATDKLSVEKSAILVSYMEKTLSRKLNLHLEK